MTQQIDETETSVRILSQTSSLLAKIRTISLLPFLPYLVYTLSVFIAFQVITLTYNHPKILKILFNINTGKEEAIPQLLLIFALYMAALKIVNCVIHLRARRIKYASSEFDLAAKIVSFVLIPTIEKEIRAAVYCFIIGLTVLSHSTPNTFQQHIVFVAIWGIIAHAIYTAGIIFAEQQLLSKGLRLNGVVLAGLTGIHGIALALGYNTFSLI